MDWREISNKRKRGNDIARIEGEGKVWIRQKVKSLIPFK